MDVGLRDRSMSARWPSMVEGVPSPERHGSARATPPATNGLQRVTRPRFADRRPRCGCNCEAAPYLKAKCPAVKVMAKNNSISADGADGAGAPVSVARWSIVAIRERLVRRGERRVDAARGARARGRRRD